MGEGGGATCTGEGRFTGSTRLPQRGCHPDVGQEAGDQGVLLSRNAREGRTENPWTTCTGALSQGLSQHHVDTVGGWGWVRLALALHATYHRTPGSSRQNHEKTFERNELVCERHGWILFITLYLQFNLR